MTNVWPQHVLTRFATIPVNPRENDYYAPYNKLLNILFPPDGPFTVGPQTHPIAESRKSIDFIVEYQVFWGDAPVFILEIKTGPKLGLVSAREEADMQIRKRLRDLVAICPLPTLHAVSAIGTKLCFYTAQVGRGITPRKIVADDEFTTDTAPVERWDCDVLEEWGAARLKAVVHEIHQACAQLDPGEIIDWDAFLKSLTCHQRSIDIVILQRCPSSNYVRYSQFCEVVKHARSHKISSRLHLRPLVDSFFR
jgi:hypothetical protein